jgi:hypothetical protein
MSAIIFTAGGQNDSKREAMAWLRERLAAGPAQAAGVIEEGEKYGFNERTLQRALKALRGRSAKGDFDKGWMWSLPGEPVLTLFHRSEPDNPVQVVGLSPSKTAVAFGKSLGQQRVMAKICRR